MNDLIKTADWVRLDDAEWDSDTKVWLAGFFDDGTCVVSMRATTMGYCLSVRNATARMFVCKDTGIEPPPPEHLN